VTHWRMGRRALRKRSGPAPPAATAPAPGSPVDPGT
jgi:hypothetical protein